MKDSRSQGRTLLLLCLAVITLNSCLGASVDISIRADGSGSMALEYRVSQMLESLGRLDGNENWPAIPVGRGDFERGIARIPGLSLGSFSARVVPGTTGLAFSGGELLTRVTLEFEDTAALIAFLGRGTSGDTNMLSMTVLEPSRESVNAELASLLREVAAGYEISISLSAPGNASLVLIPAVPQARLITEGRRVSFAIDVADLVGLQDGLVLEMRW